MKRMIQVLTAALLSLTLFYQVAITQSVSANQEVQITIHYQRQDNDYTGWNLWIWEVGQSGQSFEFTSTNEFGAVATITLEASTQTIGLIVRKGEWEAKDVDADRFIELESNQAEIWLVSGDTNIYTNADLQTEALDVPEGNVLVRVHYRRFDEAYAGWNLWMWPAGQEGKSYAFSSTTTYGVLAELTVDASVLEQGLIVRKGEWEAKDVDMDRFINLTRAKDNVLDVYLLQSDPTIYYRLSDIDLSPKILSARLEDIDRISVVLSVPMTPALDRSEGLIISDGIKQYPIKTILYAEGINPSASSRFNIFLEEGLDLSQSYTLSKAGYGSRLIQFNRVFSSEAFETMYHYEGALGALYTPNQTTFKLWAPTAQSVELNLFESGHEGEAYQRISMDQANHVGVYEVSVPGDLHEVYYSYTLTFSDQSHEAVDPYARAVGVNGRRAMVLDLSQTNPAGWLDHERPELISATDSIIYELHVRDLSISPDSGITNKGKYLGLTELNTQGPNGISTGLSHLIELGVTHVHLLPVFDFRSIDETKLDQAAFNWGYDPQHFNVPEGSYASNPYDGDVRIHEFKQMVQALHENGIRVVMDVVYNHTGASADSDFSKIVPNYYYRFNEDGSFSNGSGTGNETASERSMMRKYMIDSLVYWASEYQIDGFRFDLMGLHDIETMNMIRQALDQINPNILLYGEGWTGGSSPLREDLRAIKANAYLLDRIAVFSDDMRDGLKGNVFTDADTGFVNGKAGLENTIKFGIVAGVSHPQVNPINVLYTNRFYAAQPYHTINYVEAHDNLTLFDKLRITHPDASIETITAMHRLANAIVLTSQGIPFIHAGSEFMRTKDFDHNSYQSPDSINQLVWQDKANHIDHVEYFQGLIALRKNHPAFRLPSTEAIVDHLSFIDMPDTQMVGYQIKDVDTDAFKHLVVLINANPESRQVRLPERGWMILVDHNQVNEEGLRTISTNQVEVAGLSLMVLVANPLSGLIGLAWRIGLGILIGIVLVVGIIKNPLKKRRRLS